LVAVDSDDSESFKRGRFKIDAKGRPVDLKKAKRSEVQSLEKYYEVKLDRARSNDMKLAYQDCLDQIRGYLYDGIITDHADIFYTAYSMGLTDIRSMIKTYFGHLKSREETAADLFLEHIGKRKVVYGKARLPKDDTTRSMFAAIMRKPPRLDDAGDYFIKDYDIKPAKVLMRPSDYLVVYDPFENILTISPTKAEIQLGFWEAILIGLFEHLCECKSWKFDDEPEVSNKKQRQETTRFVERMFERCVKLGLLPPPPHGNFPDD